MGTCSETICKHRILFPSIHHLDYSRSLEIAPVRYITYKCLLAFYSSCGRILYHFRDEASYWSNIAILGPVFDAHVSGIPVGILPSHLVLKNYKRCGYPTLKEIDEMFSRFDTIPVCDGQTDILRQPVRAVHAHRTVMVK